MHSYVLRKSFVGPSLHLTFCERYSTLYRLGQNLMKFNESLWPTRGPKKPPYDHACQIGDPVLRTKAKDVDLNLIKTDEIQKTIAKLVKIMRKHYAVGISAPQIGVGLRIFVMELTKDHLRDFTPAVQEAREMFPIPLKVFVNPQLTVNDYNKVIFGEGCVSIRGFSADVPRFQAVEIQGYDKEGEPVSWKVSGWAARIIQHEMDHLDGRLFVDKMNSESFQYNEWYRVNVRGKY